MDAFLLPKKYISPALASVGSVFVIVEHSPQSTRTISNLVILNRAGALLLMLTKRTEKLRVEFIKYGNQCFSVAQILMQWASKIMEAEELRFAKLGTILKVSMRIWAIRLTGSLSTALIMMGIMSRRIVNGLLTKINSIIAGITGFIGPSVENKPRLNGVRNLTFLSPHLEIELAALNCRLNKLFRSSHIISSALKFACSWETNSKGAAVTKQLSMAVPAGNNFPFNSYIMA